MLHHPTFSCPQFGWAEVLKDLEGLDSMEGVQGGQSMEDIQSHQIYVHIGHSFYIL